MTKAKSAGNLADTTPAKVEEKPWKAIAYPSSLPIARVLQDEWREARWRLDHCDELVKLLVEKRKVVSGKQLLNVGSVTLEIMRLLDEVLCERAKRERWPGIEEEKLENLQMVIAEQSERQLAIVDWLPMFGVSERHLSEFALFYDVFKYGQEYLIPAPLVVNRAKRELGGIPAGEINLIREAFAAIAKECVKRLEYVVG